MINVKEKSLREPLNTAIATFGGAMGRLGPWDLGTFLGMGLDSMVFGSEIPSFYY